MLNDCCIYLHLLTIGEILDAAGDTIILDYLHGTLICPNHWFCWASQPRPSTLSWTLWKKALLQAAGVANSNWHSDNDNTGNIQHRPILIVQSCINKLRLGGKNINYPMSIQGATTTNSLCLGKMSIYHLPVALCSSTASVPQFPSLAHLAQS